MLSGGLIMLAARQAVRLAFRRDGGLADPICECASFREKGGMPSRPDSCGHDPATASNSDLHWKRPRYPSLGVLKSPKIKRCFMKETGPLELHRTNSANTILKFLARNVRSAVGQRPAARSLVLIVAAAALCFGVALYFGVSRTSAEREHDNHDWPNHGKDLANTRFQNLDQINPSNVKNLQVTWVFHTGVLDPLSELEASPIEVDGRLLITDGH